MGEGSASCAIVHWHRCQTVIVIVPIKGEWHLSIKKKNRITKLHESDTSTCIGQLMQLQYTSPTKSSMKCHHRWLTCTVKNKVHWLIPN